MPAFLPAILAHHLPTGPLTMPSTFPFHDLSPAGLTVQEPASLPIHMTAPSYSSSLLPSYKKPRAGDLELLTSAEALNVTNSIESQGTGVCCHCCCMHGLTSPVHPGTCELGICLAPCLPGFRSLLKCHLLREAFSGHPGSTSLLLFSSCTV